MTKIIADYLGIPVSDVRKSNEASVMVYESDRGDGK